MAIRLRDMIQSRLLRVYHDNFFLGELLLIISTTIQITKISLHQFTEINLHQL